MPARFVQICGRKGDHHKINCKNASKMRNLSVQAGNCKNVCISLPEMCWKNIDLCEISNASGKQQNQIWRPVTAGTAAKQENRREKTRNQSPGIHAFLFVTEKHSDTLFLLGFSGRIAPPTKQKPPAAQDLIPCGRWFFVPVRGTGCVDNLGHTTERKVSFRPREGYGLCRPA